MNLYNILRGHMIIVKFQKTGDTYTRMVTFPDGSKDESDSVAIPPKWHSPETWSWIKPLYEYSRDELADEGQQMAQALLGEKGMAFILENGGNGLKIVLSENRRLPEISRIPWEIAAIDGDFVLTDRFVPIIRRPDNTRLVSKLKIKKPLRMALLSASPNDQDPLMVEEELLSVALSLDDSISRGRIIVDEILNCTREKIKEIFRSNSYDIIYFTGHGSFSENTGYLILERPNGAADPLSSRDFAAILRRQPDTALVFLNCCNAATVGRQETEGRKGYDDVARKVLALGIPEVIATQAAVFDSTARVIMKTFFEELCSQDGFDIATAITVARCDAESDQNQFHDFYQFVHLSALDAHPKIDIRAREDETWSDAGLSDRVAFHTENYRPLDRSFVGRFSYISQVEDGWWTDDCKIVGIHGLGGIGKTFLSSRMENRALTHPVAPRRMNQVIWIDFREGMGNTLSGFLMQLAGLAHDLGFSEYQKVLDDHDDFPTPLEKLRPLNDLFNTRFGGRVLLILDNLETVIDPDGAFHDPELGKWFRELAAHTPRQTRLLVTCRHRFNFSPEGRELARSKWIHLTEFGFTERACLINQYGDMRNLPLEEKYEILQSVGGHPFLVNLVVNYLQRNRNLPDAIKTATRKAADYARLDAFLSLLSADAIDWLCIAALFPSPRISDYILLSKLVRDSIEDKKTLQHNLNSAIGELVDLSLIVHDRKGLVDIHPLVVYQLLENKDSRFVQPPETIMKTRRAIGVLFYIFGKNAEERPGKARALLHGIEPTLEQDDVELLNAYLQSCAKVFHGFVPTSVFAAIVLRAEKRLLINPDQDSFFTLGYCAQTLSMMRDFHDALRIYKQMLLNESLPDEVKGRIYGSIGTIYLYQRQWADALKNYGTAIEWKEKTGNHVELGSSYHQIGRVYEEQRQWADALKNYGTAIEWNEKTGNHVALGSSYHQIGRVYEEQDDFPNAFEFYKSAVEISIKTERYEALKIILSSIRRLKPNLSDGALAELEEMLPEEIFKLIMEEE
ncbi:MAG: CHAT domain-containing protein [Desulfobacterales bacterium]|nr:CHAT domain-containing protein [Desulfobacterales bacterium]